jgi:hypothetical protein
MTKSSKLKSGSGLVGLTITVLLLAGCASVGGVQGNSPFAPSIKRNVMAEILTYQNYQASEDACPECWEKAFRKLAEYELLIETNNL